MAVKPGPQFESLAAESEKIAQRLVDTDRPKIRFRGTFNEPDKPWHGQVWHENPDVPFIGGRIGFTRTILRGALTEPAEPGEEYGVEGAPLRDVSSKECRRAFAGDMGLPNTKKKSKRS